jgi:oxygen-independent coproporphyrinogen-3 oxidase
MLELYTKRLCDDIKNAALRLGDRCPQADTVYFGGGTPTLLSAAQFERIIETVERNFGITSEAEMTSEANPKTVDEEKLKNMRAIGINRLSIGVQSIHDSELRILGRNHNSGDTLETLALARKAGFDNISVDLMYGIPSQTKESIKKSVEGIVLLAPEHISSYCLTIEDGTSFGRRRDSLALPDEDTVADMYADMSEILQKNGYHKYEISNFSKEGRESRHNLKYWHLDDYLGFGPAAHSCFDSVRYANSRDIDAYLGGKDITESVEKIEKRERMNEFVMLGMRLADGVDAREFRKLFGEELQVEFASFNKFSPEYVTVDGTGCRFTEKGMFVSNYILSEVLDFEPNT